jgi:hypothetical protein
VSKVRRKKRPHPSDSAEFTTFAELTDPGRQGFVAGTAADAQLVLTRASSLRPERISWVWRDRWARGAVSLWAGQQGLGKSTGQAGLTAKLTRGTLDGDLLGTPVPVLMATAEDSVTATVIPRLIAAGADLDLVHFIDLHEGGLPAVLDLAAHIEGLRRAVRSTGAKALMIDPLVSFLDGMDSHKDQSVRRAMAPLANLAADEEIAVVGLIHLNKRDSHDALSRVSGSVAFTALARSVLVLGADRHEDDVLHLVHAKSNLSRHAPSLRCHIESAVIEHEGDEIPTSRFVVDGESEVRAEDLLSGPVSSDERGAKDEALHFLRAELADGRRVPQKALGDRAKHELDISIQTLRRAKKALGVETEQVRDGDSSHWVWFIPDASTKTAKRKAKKERRS